MMIERISMDDYVKGIEIEAYTDGYSHDAYGYLCLISILGHDSAVKAISAGIVSLRKVTVQRQGIWHSYCAMPGEKYRIMSARLESGLLHQIVALDELFNQAANGRGLIYIGTSRDMNTVIFNAIKKNLGTPLLPEWNDWLIRQIREEDSLELMQGTVPVVRLSVGERQLDSIISEGIKQGAIRF
jgi:hypothetical protein